MKVSISLIARKKLKKEGVSTSAFKYLVLKSVSDLKIEDKEETLLSLNDECMVLLFKEKDQMHVENVYLQGKIL